MKLITAIITSLVLFVIPSHTQSRPTTGTTPPALAITSTTSTTLVDSLTVSKWEKVAWCETHGDWKMSGLTFAGGLGISRVVWEEYGGLQFAPHPGLASKEEQVYIATRINSSGYVPDQNGCEGGW